MLIGAATIMVNVMTRIFITSTIATRGAGGIKGSMGRRIIAPNPRSHPEVRFRVPALRGEAWVLPAMIPTPIGEPWAAVGGYNRIKEGPAQPVAKLFPAVNPGLPTVR
jgi:hypothetical protein